MAQHTINGRQIVTHYDPPPIPWRNFDWEATASNYDPENNDPRGHGETEADAIVDLIWQLEDAEESAS